MSVYCKALDILFLLTRVERQLLCRPAEAWQSKPVGCMSAHRTEHANDAD